MEQLSDDVGVVSQSVELEKMEIDVDQESYLEPIESNSPGSFHFDADFKRKWGDTEVFVNNPYNRWKRTMKQFMLDKDQFDIPSWKFLVMLIFQPFLILMPMFFLQPCKIQEDETIGLDLECSVWETLACTGFSMTFFTILTYHQVGTHASVMMYEDGKALSDNYPGTQTPLPMWLMIVLNVLTVAFVVALHFFLMMIYNPFPFSFVLVAMVAVNLSTFIFYGVAHWSPCIKKKFKNLDMAKKIGLSVVFQQVIGSSFLIFYILIVVLLLNYPEHNSWTALAFSTLRFANYYSMNSFFFKRIDPNKSFVVFTYGYVLHGAFVGWFAASSSDLGFVLVAFWEVLEYFHTIFIFINGRSPISYTIRILANSCCSTERVERASHSCMCKRILGETAVYTRYNELRRLILHEFSEIYVLIIFLGMFSLFKIAPGGSNMGAIRAITVGYERVDFSEFASRMMIFIFIEIACFAFGEYMIHKYTGYSLWRKAVSYFAHLEKIAAHQVVNIISCTVVFVFMFLYIPFGCDPTFKFAWI